MVVREQMKERVITVGPEDRIQNAFRLLRENRIRYLPVVQGDQVVGVVTHRDLWWTVTLPPWAGPLSTQCWEEFIIQVKQIMSQPVITIGPSAPLEEAARLMKERKIGCLPVVEGNRLVGIITETDILETFVRIKQEEQLEMERCFEYWEALDGDRRCSRDA